ncbi:MAG: UDP-N-acetylglucosamine 1-carboxyvinyltransferase [Candidatus Omnitrophota bacterium]
MDKFVIEGGVKLNGEVEVSGAKNAVLPMLAATLLTDQVCVIKNVPALRDTYTMLRLLRSLGKTVEVDKGQIIIAQKGPLNNVAEYRLVSTMRGSFCVLGPLLATLKTASVSLPGGCAIGLRPVDLHIKGIKALGAEIKIENGYVVASARRLHGNHIYLGGVFGSSVLATANVMMASTRASGKTVIECAACEPEISDLADFLNQMGAKIKGQGTPIIEIEGVKELHGCQHSVIPDRIEAGTFLILAAATRSDITLKNVCWQHLTAVLDSLEAAGAKFERRDSTIKVKTRRRLKPVNITTLPYPGFPTDMQAQFMTLMATTPGISVITEKIYPDRFMHIAELNRMGAKIMKEGPHAIVEGIKRLSGAPVMASDLRASAALLIAGLVAKGKTEVLRIYHLERGYENIDDKLMKLGAKITREKE